MAVEIISRTYKNPYRAETTNFMLGNAGDWQLLEIDIEHSTLIEFSTSFLLGWQGGKHYLQLMSGEKWWDYGFEVGDTFTIQYYVNGVFGDFIRTITAINDDILMFNGAAVAFGTPTVVPTQGTDNWENVTMHVDKAVEGIGVTYGHLTNSDSESANLASTLDGTLTTFKTSGLDTVPFGVELPLDFLGKQSGMSIYSATVRYNSKFQIWRYYTVSIAYMINIYDDIANFINGVPPGPFFNTESFTDNFHLKFFPDFNNPNVKLQNKPTETDQLGNVGYRDENFNGGLNPLSLNSISYTDLALNPLSALDYQNDTRVTIVIDGVQNISLFNSRFGYGFATVPRDIAETQQSEHPFYELAHVSTGGLTSIFFPPVTPMVSFALNTFIIGDLLGFGTEGRRMDVANPFFTQTGPNQVTFTATFKPNAAFAAYMDARDEDDRNYLLWLSAGDSTLVTNFSDRVNVECDFGNMETLITPIGEHPNVTHEVWEHQQDITDGSIALYDGFVEDDVLHGINIYKANEQPWTQIHFVVRITNGTDSYELDRNSYDLSSFPTNGSGPQLIGLDEIRGYKLVAGNNKDWVKIEFDPNTPAFPNLQRMNIYFAHKMRWEDWLSRDDVPSVFYDPSQDNNGEHNDWYPYQLAAGYGLEFGMLIDADIDGEIQQYQNYFPFTIADYDSNADLSKVFRYYRASDNSPLPVTVDATTGKPLGVILDAEQTKIEVEWTSNIGPFDQLNTYATICIGIDKGAGQFEFRQISSKWLSEPDNPLIPLAGETKLKLTYTATNVLSTECLVEPSLLESAVRYKVSARIGSFFAPPVGAKEMEVTCAFKLTEGGGFKIIES